MGKYMRKVKLTGEVAVMELAQSSFGVRTRAKTLALQKKTTTTTSPSSPSDSGSGGSCYLQLRSRRLEKKPLSLLGGGNNQNLKNQETQNPRRTNSRLGCVDSGSIGSVSLSFTKNDDGGENNYDKSCVPCNSVDVAVEASFGENVLESEGRGGRSTRESTPCSLIRGSDTVGTPGSTTRATRSSTTNQRIRCSMQRNIPTTNEMEEFFASAEQQQQRIFIEKYNFDPVNETPLPGRYKWERVDE